MKYIHFLNFMPKNVQPNTKIWVSEPPTKSGWTCIRYIQVYSIGSDLGLGLPTCNSSHPN